MRQRELRPGAGEGRGNPILYLYRRTCHGHSCASHSYPNRYPDTLHPRSNGYPGAANVYGNATTSYPHRNAGATDRDAQTRSRYQHAHGKPATHAGA
jgi:hypothetical protein